MKYCSNINRQTRFNNINQFVRLNYRKVSLYVYYLKIILFRHYLGQKTEKNHISEQLHITNVKVSRENQYSYRLFGMIIEYRAAMLSKLYQTVSQIRKYLNQRFEIFLAKRLQYVYPLGRLSLSTSVPQYVCRIRRFVPLGCLSVYRKDRPQSYKNRFAYNNV